MVEPTTTPSPLTERLMELEEWADLPEDVPGELVDGRLEEEEMTGALHELVVIWLGSALRGWLAGRGGFVLGSDLKYGLWRRRGRKPDLTVFLPGTRPPPRRSLVRRPPDIAVEVVSPRPRDVRRDRIEKMSDYATFRIPWYWLLDPELRSLEVYELGADGRYVRALGTGDRVESVPGCEGLILDLPGLWEEIDRLGPEESDDTGEDWSE